MELTPQEWAVATQVGVTRYLIARASGQRHRYALNGDARALNILGATGEMAVAKAVNAYWSGVAGCGAPDVGTCLQVRAVDHPRKRLIVHRDDADDHPFVLVASAGPFRYDVRGFILGCDAKRAAWLSDPQRTSRPAYFVPLDALQPLDALVQR